MGVNTLIVIGTDHTVLHITLHRKIQRDPKSQTLCHETVFNVAKLILSATWDEFEKNVGKMHSNDLGFF